MSPNFRKSTRYFCHNALFEYKDEIHLCGKHLAQRLEIKQEAAQTLKPETKAATCGDCHGSGTYIGFMERDNCRRCGGSGQVTA